MSAVISCIIPCIEKYIQENYSGGLIGISDLAKYCNEIEGNVYVALVELENLNKVKIVKRYSCAEAHQIPADSKPYCSECDYEYSKAYITTHIYIDPINTKQISS